MIRADILSINIGRPIQVLFRNKEVSTSIYKAPVEQPLFLTKTNFEGDGQADLVHHGGLDKAVCVYPFEHYPYWEKVLQKPLAFGAFGENLTIRGFVESDICIGDIFQLGQAIVQVSQPRQPCYKLSLKYGLNDMPLQVQETGYTGFYFRVLQEGQVARTDHLTRTDPHAQAVSVAYANQIMHHEKRDIEGMHKLLAVKELSESWRSTLLKRLKGMESSSQERLNGN